MHSLIDANIVETIRKTGNTNGTSSEWHMREDLSIFDFELSSEDLKNVSLLLN